MGSSINDVTQFWTIFDSPSAPPIVTRFITKALTVVTNSMTPSPPLRPWRPLYRVCYGLRITNNEASWLFLSHFWDIWVRRENWLKPEIQPPFITVLWKCILYTIRSLFFNNVVRQSIINRVLIKILRTQILLIKFLYNIEQGIWVCALMGNGNAPCWETFKVLFYNR